MRMQLSWLQQQARDYLVGGHFLISVRFQWRREGHNQFTVYYGNVNSFKCIIRVR
jgi:hypothetical protein